MARLIQVIEADENRGAGTPDNPHRVVTVYYSVNGTMLWEYDPCAQARDVPINQQGRSVPIPESQC